MAESDKEAKIAFERLSQACDRFLGLPVKLLGVVHKDGMIPRVVSWSQDKMARQMEEIATSHVRTRFWT